MVEIKNVTVSKGGSKRFTNFSFAIAPGEHWVIQGDNGSGKSTLLQLIAGIVYPSSGKVDYSFVDGADWETRYQQRREKIHLIASYGLHELVGNSGGLFYQQRYYNIGDTQLRRVRDLFGEEANKLKDLRISENLNIEELLDLELTRLSNGQLKKVTILRQLVRNIPKLLLLDYPFDGLDAQSRRDLANFLDDIAGRLDIQMVLVDHGYTLPQAINRKLVLNRFQVERIETVAPSAGTHGDESVKPFTSAASDGEPMVEMKNLSITYSGKTILKDVNWRVNKGERWALTGKNGAGKTTLFSLIYADHPMAYSQAVYLFGKRRGTGESIWDIKNRINYMGPEQIHFLDHRSTRMSAREYLQTAAPDKPERLSELIDRFKSGPYIDTDMQYLSSGELQMVLLMKTLLNDKELLLLDEPFQFLDPHNRARVTEYVTRYLDDNITLILITHDENDVARWTQKRKHL